MLSTGDNRGMRFSQQLYERLLPLYPRAHREEYGPAMAQLPISYSHKAWHVPNRRLAWDWLLARQTDTLIPVCEREKLTIQNLKLRGD